MSSEHEPLDDPDPPPSGAGQSKKTTQKKIWMLTYCPAGTYITMDMLKAHGILADECHSTSDRAMSYTYIHLTKRCRVSLIEKFLSKAREDNGIVKKEVFGYESIGSRSTEPGSAKIRDHIVFKMLTTHANDKNPSFSPCTDGEPTLKRGHIFEACEICGDHDIPLESRTKAQVIDYARKLEQEKTERAGSSFSVYSNGKPVAPTTLGTLLHYRRHGATRKVMRRVARWEERLNVKEESQLTSSHDGSGEIYAAWNSLMPSLYKKGFSFKDAATRVRALQTAGVLEPFKLVRHARVPDAR